MTIEKYLNGMNKDLVSDYYYHIVSDKKDYDKITKKKMIEAIIKEYSNPDVIADICTEKELRILEQIINKTFKITPKVSFNLINLSSKLLINFGYDIEIMPSLEKNVKTALKSIDWKEVKKKDQINEFIVPFIKVMGNIYDEVLFDIASEILHISKKDIIKHCQKNKLFNYYIDTFTRFIPSLNQDVTEFYYLDYLDYLDELDAQRRIYGKSITRAINLDDYINIFYNKVNVNNPKVKKMFEVLSHNKMAPIILDQINITVLLNEDYDSFLSTIIYLIDNNYTEEELVIIEEGMREIPSGALNGLTLNEYEKLEQEEEEYNQEEEQMKQKNAHVNKKDCDLFYKLYKGLLEYTNNTYHVAKKIKIYDAKYVDASIAVKIRDYLWEHKEIINEFISKNPYHFNNTELKLLKEFNKGKLEYFVIAKYEENYTIFIDTENGEDLYKVKGLTNNIDEVINKEKIPCFVRTALIPFKGNIIYDSLFNQLDIELGLDFRKTVKTTLKEGKYKNL